jgi:hypothetical protein
MKWMSCLALTVLVCVGACTTTQAGPAKCKSFLVLPVAYADDEAISDEITRRWKKAVQKKMAKCDKFVHAELNKESFQLINVDFSSETNLKSLTSVQLEVLKDKTEASHIVGLPFEKSGNVFVVHPEVIEIDGKEAAYKAFAKKIKIPIASKKLNPSTFKWLSIKMAGSMPNALLIGISDKELNNDREGNEVKREDLQRTNTTLTRVLSSIALFSVPNSAEFGLFDTSTRWYPALNLSAFNDEYTYRFIDQRKEPVGDPFLYRVSAFSVAGSIIGEAAIHTPLGATFVIGGLGVGVFYIDDDFSEVFGLSGVLSYGLGHRAFLSDSFFVSLSAQADIFEPSFIDNPYFKASSYRYLVFGLGYFFPGAKTVARRIID